MSRDIFNFPPYSIRLSNDFDKLETKLTFSGVTHLVQALIIVVKADVSSDRLFVHTANSDYSDSASLICFRLSTSEKLWHIANVQSGGDININDDEKWVTAGVPYGTGESFIVKVDYDGNIMTRNPRSGYEIVQFAETDLANGDKEQAKIKFRDALKTEISPNTKASVLRQLGEIAEEEGNTKLAIRQYEKALILNPRVGVKKKLSSLTNMAPKATSRQVRKSKNATTSKRSVERVNQEEGIPVRWIEGEKLSGKTSKASYKSKVGRAITIEQYALDHYCQLGYKGIWSENDYWWAIMALLFWDVIFAKLPGVYSPEFGSFPSKMQDMPQDFFSSEFYQKRKEIIEKRRSELTKARFLGIQQPNIEEEIKAAYKKYKGVPCRAINWGKYSDDQIFYFATGSLNNVQLLDILERLLQNFVENRRGMPDLYLANNLSPLFVEVKSEQEKIAAHQFKWLKFLKNEIGVNVEICRVIDQ